MCLDSCFIVALNAIQKEVKTRLACLPSFISIGCHLFTAVKNKEEQASIYSYVHVMASMHKLAFGLRAFVCLCCVHLPWDSIHTDMVRINCGHDSVYSYYVVYAFIES